MFKIWFYTTIQKIFYYINYTNRTKQIQYLYINSTNNLKTLRILYFWRLNFFILSHLNATT